MKRLKFRAGGAIITSEKKEKKKGKREKGGKGREKKRGGGTVCAIPTNASELLKKETFLIQCFSKLLKKKFEQSIATDTPSAGICR